LSSNRPSSRTAFTLVELIVVIIIIALIAGFSAMAYVKIAKNMRLSTAKNTIIAALDNARAFAIKNNRYVITVFRPKLTGDGTQQFFECVVAQWSGDSQNYINDGYDADDTVDRFVPIDSVKPKYLPVGIGVAGPGYGLNADHIWWTPTYLPANAVVKDDRFLQEMVGVLYSPEGKVVLRNAISASVKIWVDFDRDGLQTVDLALRDGDAFDPVVIDWTQTVSELDTCWPCFSIEAPESETFIGLVNLIAVFDNDSFREQWGATGTNYPNYTDIARPSWDRTPNNGEISRDDRDWHYTDFITKTADRIQFNTYSGVPEK
jgi:prepilin-type N-terminal cleavage/methylation domain-containing protein